MKKFFSAAYIFAISVFIVDWGYVGVLLLNGNYEIRTGAYIGIGCLAVILLCALHKAFGTRCPCCGKTIPSYGSYCPHCGRNLKK